MCRGPRIELDDLPPEVTSNERAAPRPGLVESSVEPAASSSSNLREDLAGIEKRRIIEALDRCDGNQTKAAQLLGMPRRTFVMRVEEYGLPRPRKGRDKK
jgi:DNA-binding NtrC family response regulator